METFETTLTGSDGNIDGIVTHISKEAYQFTSLDNSLQLTIAKAPKGKWIRLSGTEPYLSGWVDELCEAIAAKGKPATASTQAKKTVATSAKTTVAKKSKPAASATKKAKVS